MQPVHAGHGCDMKVLLAFLSDTYHSKLVRTSAGVTKGTVAAQTRRLQTSRPDPVSELR